MSMRLMVQAMFQHTAARRRLPSNLLNLLQSEFMFQHTAARRRLQ